MKTTFTCLAALMVVLLAGCSNAPSNDPGFRNDPAVVGEGTSLDDSPMVGDPGELGGNVPSAMTGGVGIGSDPHGTR